MDEYSIFLHNKKNSSSKELKIWFLPATTPSNVNTCDRVVAWLIVTHAWHMAMGSNMSVWGKIWRGQIYNRYVDPPSSRKPKQSASLHWSIKLNMSFITNGLDTSKVYKRSQPPGGDVLTCLATLKQSQRKASHQRRKLLSLHLRKHQHQLLTKSKPQQKNLLTSKSLKPPKKSEPTEAKATDVEKATVIEKAPVVNASISKTKVPENSTPLLFYSSFRHSWNKS